MQSIYTETLLDSTSFDMIFVEGGEFRMGSYESRMESPTHQVSLDDFYMSKFPVTQELWTHFMREWEHFTFTGSLRPVKSVSWEDCQEFIEKLNGETGKVYRLPTEAEWEYAARGGQFSQDYTYAGSNKIEEVALYRENSDSETKDVGLKQPNELGLYDMSGNVTEWCLDWFSFSYYPKCLAQGIVHNPQGPEPDDYRVYRGGGYFSNSKDCRSSNRGYLRPEIGGPGLRLVFSPQFPERLDSCL